MYGLRPMATNTTSASSFINTRLRSPTAKERIGNYALSRVSVLSSLRHDYHLPAVLLCREDLCVQLEPETLLDQRLPMGSRGRPMSEGVTALRCVAASSQA